MGILVVDEVLYRIASVTLREGKLLFATEHQAATGPVIMPAVSEVRIHGDDGSLIACAPWRLPEADRAVLSKLRPGETYSIVMPMAVAQVTGWPVARSGAAAEA